MIPSSEQLRVLRSRIAKKLNTGGGDSVAERQGRERRISRVFVRELRKRGWLQVEGYAPGSWAAE